MRSIWNGLRRIGVIHGEQKSAQTYSKTAGRKTIALIQPHRPGEHGTGGEAQPKKEPKCWGNKLLGGSIRKGVTGRDSV